MSSTNRGSKRIEADFYKTPKEAFVPLIPYIAECKAKRHWEPACGDGRLIEWMQFAGLSADGKDIRGSGYDFLKDDHFYDCVVTNPPFTLAFEFCDHAWRNAEHLFLLLPLNFLGSVKRREWFYLHEPDALFVLGRRPSFTDDGKTDSVNYAWYYWGPTHTGIHHL